MFYVIKFQKLEGVPPKNSNYNLIGSNNKMASKNFQNKNYVLKLFNNPNKNIGYNKIRSYVISREILNEHNIILLPNKRYYLYNKNCYKHIDIYSFIHNYLFNNGFMDIPIDDNMINDIIRQLRVKLMENNNDNNRRC